MFTLRYVDEGMLLQIPAPRLLYPMCISMHCEMAKVAWEGIQKQAIGDSIDEFFREKYGGLVDQSDAAQIAGDDAQAQPPLHPVLPVIGAFAPPVITPQTGNALLDARTPPIAPPPTGCRPLHSCLIGGCQDFSL